MKNNNYDFILDDLKKLYDNSDVSTKKEIERVVDKFTDILFKAYNKKVDKFNEAAGGYGRKNIRRGNNL
ncbi:hypothetical protein B5E87_00155 [Massilimicrobiota sp. An142]|uniref:hypothetical protein n=1 Tax=Massilimicrobiota sp. An142 TaxID=1965564 RepID=UPI000B3A1609|nr:hypothetical protein [Massilimicrobiota sp. An142]OUQ15018.1 hypothetical protein B5E87_00155 [Massilimicrobiota sp. An142]